ncbi:hypothetical protein ACJMK2_014091, partial [Sinanodonta woodiana]
MNRRKSNEQASQPESTKRKRSRNGDRNKGLDSSGRPKPKSLLKDLISHDGDIQKNLGDVEDDHSLGLLDTKTPCSSSDAENFEEDLSVSHTPSKTSLSCKGSFLINASEDREILEVLYNVKNSKKLYKQEKLRDELSDIQQRVQMALENFPVVKEEQQTRNDRNNILFTIETYISRSVIHRELLMELELWYKNKDNLPEDFGLLSHKDMNDIISSSHDLHNNILEDIEIMSNTGKRIITLGLQLLDEIKKVRKNDSHLYKQHDPLKKSMREKIVIHNALEAARKQYQYLMNVADQENNELKEKGRQCIELSDNIAKAESQCKELQKQLQDTRYKDFKIRDGTDNFLLQMEMQNERNQELKAKVADYQNMIAHNETKIKMQESEAHPASVPRSKTLSPSAEYDIASQPSSTQSVLSALYIPEEAYSETLLQLLTSEEQLTTSKNETSNLQKLIARKKLTSELDKIKMDVLRKKMRHEDETVHSEEMSFLKKNIHGVLRALVSFKDQLTQVLLKENLQDVAEKLDKLENLSEKLSPDSTDAIGMVVSNVVDYLHSLQEIIIYGFEEYKYLFQAFQASTPLPAMIKPNQEKTKLFVTDVPMQRDVLHHSYPGVQNMMPEMNIIKDIQHKDLREMPDNVSKHNDLTVVELDRNLALIVKAYEENKVSKPLYKKAVTAIQRVKCVPLLKLETLMEWYIEVKKMEQLRESYIALIEAQNRSGNTGVDLENYMLTCQKRKQQKILETQEKWKKIEHQKKELNARMLKIFNKLYDETGIMLIYPMLWDTNTQSKIQRNSLPPLEQKTLRNMLCNRGRTKCDIFKLPEVVSGVAMPIRRSLTRPQIGTFTKQVSMPGNCGEPFLPAVIMTPHIVNYQINRPHMHAV